MIIYVRDSFIFGKVKNKKFNNEIEAYDFMIDNLSLKIKFFSLELWF